MNKKIDEIKKIILDEIKASFEISTWHGVDVEKCLVEPYLDIFEKSFKEGETVDLYVVLEEHSNRHEGYLIVYNSEEKLFGLVLVSKCKHGLLLGYYDTFLETLKGM